MGERSRNHPLYNTYHECPLRIYAKAKEKHEKSLEILAKKIAKEVATTKIEAKLDSMNSYERRIIHNTLTNNKKVYTESEGEEPNRYVIIKPKEEIE